MSHLPPEVVRAIEALRKHASTPEEIVALLSGVSDSASSLLDAESYKYGKRLEDARSDLRQAVRDRSDYYDPLLLPNPNPREAHKFITAARYMMAYPPELEDGKREESGSEYLRGDDYYKDWLGRKLGFSREECHAKTVAEIDQEAQNNIEAAIAFMKRYVRNLEQSFEEETGMSATNRFRSEYFDELHNERVLTDDPRTPYRTMTVKEYVSMYFELEKLKLRHKKLGNVSGVQQFDMAQWEIRRLLAITMRYRDNERTPDAMLHKIDQNALVDKISKLIAQNDDRNLPPLPSGSSNRVFEHTTSHYISWSKNENGGYDIEHDDAPTVGSSKFRLESATLKGKLDPGDRGYRTRTFELEHLQIRTLKDADSRLEKSLRKPAEQVLDYTGMIMVLKDYGQLDELLDMLVSELGASYREGLENVPNSQGNCKKCVLKIPHDFKRVKEDVSMTSETLASLHNDVSGNKKLKKLKHGLNTLGTHLASYYDIASKLERDLFVEVQFFDLPSYISAEQDLSSPTHHDEYKDRQRRLQVVPILFPGSVYGEEVMQNVYLPKIAKCRQVEAKDILP